MQDHVCEPGCPQPLNMGTIRKQGYHRTKKHRKTYRKLGYLKHRDHTTNFASLRCGDRYQKLESHTNDEAHYVTMSIYQEVG